MLKEITTVFFQESDWTKIHLHESRNYNAKLGGVSDAVFGRVNGSYSTYWLLLFADLAKTQTIARFVESRSSAKIPYFL
jgi:hypothetical protein